jgi:prepilin-type N-terminal cleavage/methylation domain-containing protein
MKALIFSPFLQERRRDGFSLIELMIAVAILAILAAIAIPVYQNYISTGKQKSAESVLEQIPLLLETFRAENGRFPLNGNYTYVEAANGTVTTNTIGTGDGRTAGGGAGLLDFRPRSSTQPTTIGIPFNYSLTITNSGTATEAATFTATGVRDGAGITASGSY